MNIEKHGARRIGRVRHMQSAAGQMPEQEGIDRSEGELSALRAGARTCDIVEDPGDFRGGKIRIDQQA